MSETKHPCSQTYIPEFSKAHLAKQVASPQFSAPVRNSVHLPVLLCQLPFPTVVVSAVMAVCPPPFPLSWVLPPVTPHVVRNSETNKFPH